jgi:hypothetical protein
MAVAVLAAAWRKERASNYFNAELKKGENQV